MTCGCQNAAFTTARERAAVCAVCPSGGRNATVCRRGPQLDYVILGLSACPAGRHKAAERLWIGVPWPVRVWLHVMGGPHPDEFAGCGCLRAVKSWLERWALPLPD